MKIKDENGIKWITCDSLGEVVEEFKKFRAVQIAAGQQRKYDDYFFLQMLRHKVVEVEGGMTPKETIDSVEVYQQDGVDLALNLVPLNLKEKEWTPYGKKVQKILKEIWETGEVKNYQCLDLNWPVVSQPGQNRLSVCCDQCHKFIGDEKLAWFVDRKKNLDFCSEGCHSKFRKHNDLEKESEGLKKEINNKNIWMIISIVAVSVFSLALLFCWLKIKKLKKR